MAAQTIDILPAQPSGTVDVFGMDDETKAMLGFLARFDGATRANYELDLRQFKQWTLDFGLRSMLAAERYQLELYVQHLKERGIANATIGRRFGTIRRWYRFAHVDGLIERDPAAHVAVPKIQQDQQYRTWFESVDMAILLRTATDPKDRAILQVMFDLALRVGELCKLDVTNIVHTTSGPMLRFIGKGHKLAEMLIPPASMIVLDAYLAGRTDGPLFLNRDGDRMTRAGVQRIIDRLSRDAGITYRVTPHGIRRTSCRFGIQQGETIDDAAGRLRHSDSRVTRACYALETGVADVNRSKVSAQMANLSR